jgi:ELWxxDGT repeat protein
VEAGGRAILEWDDGSPLWSVQPADGTVSDLAPGHWVEFGPFALDAGAGAFLESESELGLWRTHGTPATSAELVALPADLQVFSAAEAAGAVYFVAEPGEGPVPRDVWRADPATGQAERLFLNELFDSTQLGPIEPLGGTGLLLLRQAFEWHVLRPDDSPHGVQIVASGTSSGDGDPVAELSGRLYWVTWPDSLVNPYWPNTGLLSVDLDGGEPELVAFVGDLANFSTDLESTDSGRLLLTLDVAVAPDHPELWSSDGTAEGTFEIELAPEHLSAHPSQLTPVADRIFFTAFDDEHGFELWVTDGTPGGTMLFADIRPGPISSRLSELTYSNGALWFGADDGATGLEPWTLRFDVHPYGVFEDGFESGSWLAWSGSLPN